MTRLEPMPSPSLLEPATVAFADDGSIRNNPRQPFRIYRGGIELKGIPDPEARIESTFASNDGGEMWRGCTDRFVDFHSMIETDAVFGRPSPHTRLWRL